MADPRISLANLTCGANKTAPQNIIPNFVQQMEGINQLMGRRGWGTAFETGANPIYGLAQCMNDLSPTDCQLCFTEARTRLPRCIPALSARIHLDGCFLRWDDYSFYEEATDNHYDTSVCNSSAESIQDNLNSDFTSKVKEVIANVTDTAVRGYGFAVSGFEKGVLNVYALAQCWQTLNTTGCQQCLEKAAREVNQCLPGREGRGLNTGCYLRYSTYKFYNDELNQSDVRNRNQSNGGTNFWLKIGIGLGAGIACILVTIMLLLGWKKGYLSSEKISWKRKTKDQRLVEIFFKNYGSMAPERYSYSDIKKVTNTFKDKIGQGGYGEVYKGKLSDGRLVAVKLLKKDKGSGEEFISEVATISRTSHVNIVSLLGFCFDETKRALVYEFMENGSLEKFIYDHNTSEAQSHLGWQALFQIATGVARGLEYLHRGCNTLILHFDIKPHNILLDHDFNPKISDFGLAKLYTRDESIASMLTARGTFGYIAPEMINRSYGRVSHKSDVYSYGMMVLEVVGKRKNYDVGANHTSEVYFPQWVYRSIELDEDLKIGGVMSDEEREITRKMILVALWCIQTKPVDRPAMSRVVEMLEGKLELLSIPPKPYLCSPPRSPTSNSSRLRNSISPLDSQGSSMKK